MRPRSTLFSQSGRNQLTGAGVGGLADCFSIAGEGGVLTAGAAGWVLGAARPRQ
ncbi:MAG: hypothetical protein QM770_12565 [Tepidisphaeraceae bacterium]